MRERIQTIPPDKLKDVLITKTAIKTLKSEELVEKVIIHQFKSARDAFKAHSEVEVSGFGKFLISSKRLNAKIKSNEAIMSRIHDGLERDKDLPEWRIKLYNMRLQSLEEDLEYMKTKINEDRL